MKQLENNNTTEIKESENQNQSVKTLTLPFPKPQYYELRLDAMKRNCKVPEIAAEIFMLGWERYQQQKQSA